MGVITGTSREQYELTCLDTMVREDAIARVVDMYVDNVVMGDGVLKEKFQPKWRGRPSYPANGMVKLFIYGYLKGIRSSRKLAEATAVNIEVMWLMNSLKPDFRTIADFRKDHIDDLVQVYRTFVEFCRPVVIDGKEGTKVFDGFKSVDGTKVRANQSKDGVYTANKIDDRIANTETRISQFVGYLADIEANDMREEKEDLSSIPDRKTCEEKLRYYKEHKEKLCGIRDRIEETGQQYSEVDPDARLMKSHYGGYNPSYNIQTVVDSNSHLIENFVATNNATDHGLLLDSVHGLDGVQELVADNGYNQRQDLARCLENGIRPNVFPDNRVGKDGVKTQPKTIVVSFEYEPAEISMEDKASKDPDVIRKCLRAGEIPELLADCLSVPDDEKDRFTEEKEFSPVSGFEFIDDLDEAGMKRLAATGWFIRDIAHDRVYCPQGVVLRKKSRKKDGLVRYCNKLQCRTCSNKCFRESKTTKWKEVDFRTGERARKAKDDAEPLPGGGSCQRRTTKKKRMVNLIFRPDFNKLDRRKCLSEHPFGTIKRYQNSDHFLLRTLDKVKGEAALMCLGYNLKRLCTLVSVPTVLALMQG